MKKFISILISIVLLLNVITSTYAWSFKKQNNVTRKVTNLNKLGLKSLHEKVNELPLSKMPSMGVIPAKVDYSSKMPPVGDQGNQGSCVAWAAGYYYKGYQEAKDWGWSVTYSGNLFSPAFIYNQINGGQDGGAYINKAFELLQIKGDCREKHMTYNENDYTTQPNATQIKNASYYKAEYVYSISDGDVPSLKNWLASGDLAVLAIPVSYDFDMIGNDLADGNKDIYDVFDPNSYRGNHAICLVGYDDSKQAFKFVNSWSTSWGLNGYGWISYDLIQSYGWDANVQVDEDNGHKITFKSVSRYYNNGAGSQWSYQVRKTNSSGTLISKGKYIYTTLDKVWIKVVEDDGATKYDDIAIKTTTLKNGDNAIYLTVYETSNKSKYAKWKFIINKRD